MNHDKCDKNHLIIKIKLLKSFEELKRNGGSCFCTKTLGISIYQLVLALHQHKIFLFFFSSNFNELPKESTKK